MPVFSTILSGSQGLYLSGSLAHSGSADLYGQTSFSGPAAAELASFEDAEAKGRIGVYDDRITMTYAAASVASAPEIYLRKSRGTLASPVVPNANDVLGEIVWQGYDTGWAKSVRIIGKAAAAHGGSSTDAPGKLEIWTTPDASDTPVKALTIESDQSATFEGDIQVGGNDIKDGGGNTQVTFTNASKAAFAYNVDVGGDLTVDGNNIKDAGGSSGITFDGSGNTTVDGTLTVAGAGGYIYGPTDGQLKLYSEKDVIIKIDTDNDDDHKFMINVHGDNTKFSVDESGNVDIAGNIQMNDAQYVESVDGNDSDLNLRATGNVKMWIDSDGSTANVRSFLIMTGSDGDSDAVFRIDESGNLTTGGSIQIGGDVIHASDGGNTITMDTSDNVTIGNNLKVGGNIIQASDGGSTITMDTSDNVTIGGNITAGSGNFIAAAGQGLTLQSSYNATIYIDTDEDSTATFKVSTGPTGGPTNMLTVDESGNMDLVGALKVGGNIIKASDGGSTITMDTNDKVTLAGILQVSGNEILDNAGNTMFRFDGAGNIDDVAVITQDVVIGGAAPSLTLGDGGDEDVRLQFNSDVNDFYVGSDNATDTLQIGAGSGVGLNVGWQIVSSSLVAMPEGVYQSPAVTTGKGGSTNNAVVGQWIRILKTPTGGVTSQKQTGGVYLVSMAGTDYDGASYQADWSWIVSVRYGTNGNPMDLDATSIRVEQLNTSILGSSLTAFDPTTDIKLVDDGARNAEVWIKNISRYKQCFVTHLGGGSNGSDLSDRNDKSFEVQASQTWFGSAPVGAGANVFGQWSTKKFDAVQTNNIETMAGISALTFDSSTGKINKDVEIISTGGTDIPILALTSLDISNADGPELTLQHYKTGYSMVDGTNLGEIRFKGSENGTDWAVGSLILSEVDKPDASEEWEYGVSTPANLSFWTCSSGSAGSNLKRMTLTATGSMQYYGSSGDSTNYAELNVGLNGATTLSTTDSDGTLGHLTFDVDGDITLDADGGQVYFFNGGVEAIQFDVDSTPTVTFTGNTKLDSTGTLELESTGDMTFDPSGDFIIDDADLVLESASGTWCKQFLYTHDNGSNFYPLIMFRRSAGTKATPLIVADGDLLGSFQWQGYNSNGSDYDAACSITGYVDGTPGNDSSDMPGKLQFNTSANGSSSPTARMTIDSVGFIGIGDTTPSTLLTVVDNAATTPLLYVDNQSTTGYCLKIRSGPDSNPGNAVRYVTYEDGNGTDIGWLRGDGSGGIQLTDAFTGQHPSVMPSSDYAPGMIVESTGELWAYQPDIISCAIPKVRLTTSDSSKTVFGVLSQVTGSYSGYEKAYGVDANETPVEVNGLGEGQVWVTDKDGEIENGDYIVSSVISGYGTKQADDILRSCTVAKCTEAVDWSTVADSITYDGTEYKKYLVGCTYHSS